MLPQILSGGDPLVTIDYDILDDNASFVPQKNPGVVIVKYVVIRKLMTTSDAAQLLSDFKARYPGWSTRDWSGLCLEVTEDGVSVSHSYKKPSSVNQQVSYTSAKFEEELDSAIARVIASRLLSTN